MTNNNNKKKRQDDEEQPAYAWVSNTKLSMDDTMTKHSDKWLGDSMTTDKKKLTRRVNSQTIKHHMAQ